MLASENLSADSTSITEAVNAPVNKFFHGAHWGQCLELLSYLCQYSDSILLVSGPKGIGKTALKEALINGYSERFDFCEIVSNADLDIEEIMSRLENGFAVSSKELIITSQERDLILLIEDAENLNTTVLSGLLQLKHMVTTPGRLHLVLFADSQLESNIQRSPIKEKFNELVHTIELEPLTLNEVEEFLVHIWRVSGNHIDIPLDKAAYKKIHALSDGLPGKVQELANDIIDGKEVKKMNLGTKRLSPFSVGLTVSFGLLFCLLAFLWPTTDRESIIAQNEVETIPDVSSDLQPVSAFAPQQEYKIDDPLLDQAASESSGQITEFALAADSNSDQNNTVNTASSVPIDVQPAAQQNVTIDATAPIAAHEYDSYAEKIARLETKLIALQSQVEKEQDARHLAEEKVQQILRKETRSAEKPVLNNKRNAKKLIGSRSRDEKYILSLPSHSYTLQLLGSSKESKVKEFMKENKLGEKAYYYRSARQGKPWFILVYGNYASKSAALTACNTLPSALRKSQPWPRELNNVQRTIKKSE